MKNKSITITDNLRTNLKPIVVDIFKNSPVLSAIGNTVLPSKFTYIPYTQIPEATDSSYVVGGLLATKALDNVLAEVTDETIEDAAIDIEGPLRDVITAQVRMKLETSLVTALKALTTTSLTDAPDARSAIIKLLAEFDPKVFSITDRTTVLVSYATYFELAFEGDPLTRVDMLNIVPCAFLADADNDVIILHGHGAYIGYDIKDIEVVRKGSTGSNEINVQGTLGTAFSTDYVKRTTF